MTREHLPDRRRNWTQRFKVDDGTPEGRTFYLCVGFYEDGRPGEIFITVDKEGSFAKGLADSLARQASTALQCGTPISEVVKSLRYMNFPPKGQVTGSMHVKECRSIVDAIAQELEAEFVTGASGDPGVPAAPESHG